MVFPPSPDFANEQHKLIKAVTAVAAGTELPVLYGGSVNPQNCVAILQANPTSTGFSSDAPRGMLRALLESSKP